MFRHSRLVRLLLHAANIAVIVFILLPVAAVVVGSVQSEKSLQADSTACCRLSTRSTTSW